jgi:O-antigen/teichoic acid export membrane protein
MAGTLLTNVSIALLGIGTGVLAARLLGPDGRGELAALMTWPQMIAALGFMSLGDAVVTTAGVNRQRRPSEIGAAFVIAAVLFGLVSVVGYGILPALLGPERQNRLFTARWFLVVFVAVNYLTLLLISFKQAQLHFALYNRMRVFPSAAYLLAILALWGLNLVSAVSFLGAFVVSLLITAVAIISSSLPIAARFPTRVEIGFLARRAATLHSHTVLAQLAAYVDRATVLLIFGNVEAGIYAVAWTVASTAHGIVSSAFSIVLLPFSTQDLDPKARGIVIARNLRLTTLLLALISVVVCAVIPFALPIVFGAEFANAVVCAAILVLAIALAVVRQVVAASLKAVGQVSSVIRAELTATVVFVGGVEAMGAALNLERVAVSVLIANLAALIPVAVGLSRQSGVTLSACNGFNRATARELLSIGRNLMRRYRLARSKT